MGRDAKVENCSILPPYLNHYSESFFTLSLPFGSLTCISFRNRGRPAANTRRDLRSYHPVRFSGGDLGKACTDELYEVGRPLGPRCESMGHELIPYNAWFEHILKSPGTRIGCQRQSPATLVKEWNAHGFTARGKMYCLQISRSLYAYFQRSDYGDDAWDLRALLKQAWGGRRAKALSTGSSLIFLLLVIPSHLLKPPLFLICSYRVQVEFGGLRLM